MIRIRDIALPPDHSEDALKKKAACLLHLSRNEITSLQIRRRSLDARKKQDIRYIYTVDVTISPKNIKYRLPRDPRISRPEDLQYAPPLAAAHAASRPIIIGFGPAGMFAALILARVGLRPVVLERGEDVDTRTQKVKSFWAGGPLDPECNVQFGEGGAGTFSDGKLNTGTHNIRIAWVLEQLHRFGADKAICYDAKPHIGTDVLRKIVKNLREEVISLGGEVHFGTKMTELITSNGAINGLRAVCCGEPVTYSCNRVILAIGHSARDTFLMLHEAGVPMEAKPFAMGVRIEHSQLCINRAQYGETSAQLPPADYKLHVHLPSGGSAYTFCMCPGGYVVAASSEEGGTVTNGMSERARDGANANSALLVGLTPDDFPGNGPLRGMYWQRKIEQDCYQLAGCTYKAPAQTVGSFLGHAAAPEVTPTYTPGVVWCDLHDALPRRITQVLEEALPILGQRLRGFDAEGAVLTAPETRSSSPVRINRSEDKQSLIKGLFPCGEGAGYAGGITSAAVDGILCAEALIESL